MRKTTTRERGETLVETLVALAIVALAMLMVPMCLTVATRVTSDARRTTERNQVDLGTGAGTTVGEVDVVLHGEAGDIDLGLNEVRRTSAGGLYSYA